MSAPAAKNLGPAPVRIRARQVWSASASVDRLGDAADDGATDRVGGGVIDGDDGQSAIALDSHHVVQDRGHRRTPSSSMTAARNGNAPDTARGLGAIISAVTELPPLPEMPPAFEQESLSGLDDAALEELVSALAGVERATVTAMAPHQAQLRELRARSGQIATERRRRERAAHIAARAAVREQAKSGEMPTVVDALAAPDLIPDDWPLAEVAAFLKSGGEVRFGYATRPGAVSFTDGREVRNARTWGEAHRLFVDGWEPGSPGVPGVRVHLVGTRVERVVDATDVVVRAAVS